MSASINAADDAAASFAAQRAAATEAKRMNFVASPKRRRANSANDIVEFLPVRTAFYRRLRDRSY
ncbi:hypothetical protein [Variovorax sp.]|uniref:hypothetical protein n=1 Tax=Variovorax sp. TaxID=1871043 RepID=UPI002D7852EB|nr:hypothetical protein [Variovorax sp.]